MNTATEQPTVETAVTKIAAEVQTTPSKAKTKSKPDAIATPTETSKTPVANQTAKTTAAARAGKPLAAPAKVLKENKHAGKKPKLVRDSFTFPAVDYALIGSLKQRALKAGHDVKKSELLRAGLAALTELSDSDLLEALQAIERLKPGRPVK